jgi:hypothetical protein
MSQTVDRFSFVDGCAGCCECGLEGMEDGDYIEYSVYAKLETEHQKSLATVMDRESASTARYDARIDALEAENTSLQKLLKEYREEHETCFYELQDMRCILCRKYDALESK